MNSFLKILVVIFGSMYAYCTDFIINLSNLFGVSYYEMNFMLFIVLFPLVFLATVVYYSIQRKRLRVCEGRQHHRHSA